MKNSQKILIVNRKAYHDYEILEKIEAGLVLTGTEIKSLRQGKASIKEAFAYFKDNEIYIYDMNITPYEQGNRFNHDPKRKRKLLLHKREIRKLISKITQKGLTLVPLKIYLKNSKAKLELGVGRGKKLYDKREYLKKKDALRETKRMLKERY